MASQQALHDHLVADAQLGRHSLRDSLRRHSRHDVQTQASLSAGARGFFERLLLLQLAQGQAQNLAQVKLQRRITVTIGIRS